MKKNLKKLTAALGAVAFGVAATTTAASASTIYTVQSGDTLSSISRKFANDDSLIDTLAQRNNIQDINKIYAGQQLVVDTDDSQAQPQQTAATTTAAPVQTATQTTQANSSYVSNVSGSEAAAKAWIANRESSNNYGARNGQYIGKYQLSASYLNGDYSAANQERVADQYVASRYGSWTAAQQFWQNNGWY